MKESLVLRQSQDLMQVKASHVNVADAILQRFESALVLVMSYELLHHRRRDEGQPIVQEMRFEQFEECNAGNFNGADKRENLIEQQ